MDIQKTWNKAVKNTEIIRHRVSMLLTFEETVVPYIFLAESKINRGDTVVRKGEIVVEKPSLILPPNIPQFEGFELEGEETFNDDALMNLMLVRGISIPSMKYNNKTVALDIYEGKLKKAVEYYLEQLQQEENVRTGLIAGPEDCWQFSVLIFICSQVVKNAQMDIKKILDHHRRIG